ncbi:MarR family transcriptional regulator [Vibrio vulnificus]|uniref:MarR family winged helix-turn-helix transcriptional regulator n=1 Tax=Vibrio vulnificus TaxID=672 RepID=UPI00034809E5|nr:MarR family transcriptional regulator [Vibrio vulnificus]KFK61692.1 MarR family transcriptional regulator [Vibrio vulnificus]POC44852.1 MarR family transcriptional regulator [Vibrio vulnificus]
MSEQTIRCQGDSEAQLLLENQICFPLYSAANAVIRAYRPLLEAFDLTYSQYLVLLVLWQQNGINVKDLGAKLHLDSGTLTPLLKRLEAKGIVERRHGQTDERVRELFLTEVGRALKQQAQQVPQNMLCRIDLSIDELVTLKSLCEKVLEKLN